MSVLICVECGAPVPHLYREFSPGNIRMTTCSNCGSFADKYVEYELILILLDLMLLKTEVYRHCLYNTSPATFRRTLLKLVPTFICLDVYVHWMRLLKFWTTAGEETDAIARSSPSAGDRMALEVAQSQSIASGETFIWPYNRHVQIIIVQTLAVVSLWIGVLLASTVLCASSSKNISAGASKRLRKSEANDDIGEKSIDSAQPSPSSPLLYTLLLASFGKLFALLPLIWSQEYVHIHAVSRGLRAFVWVCTIKALQVQLNINAGRSALLVFIGIATQLMCMYLCAQVDPLLLPTSLWL